MKYFSRKPKFMSNRWIKLAASVRFAIPVLFLFAATMTAGTICESLYGTDYARRVIYQTRWFYLILGSIALSLTLAMIDRIPIRKRLAGFYLVHISLLIIMSGGVITRYYGLDGSIELRQGEFSNSVRVAEDYFYLWDGQNQRSLRLPDVSSPTDINGFYKLAGGGRVDLSTFLPYAEAKPSWVASPKSWASSWLLKNDRFEQRVDLFKTPGSPATIDMGPLRISIVPLEVFDALRGKTRGQFLLIDEKNGHAYGVPENAKNFTLPGSKIRVSQKRAEKMKLTFYELEGDGPALRFFPKFSSKPVTNHLDVMNDSPYSLVELAHFSKTNTVLLARTNDNGVRYALGKESSWQFGEFDGKSISLPWMGFTMTVLEQHFDQRLAPAYVRGTPHREEEKNIKAVLLTIEKDGQREELWVTNRSSARSPLGIEDSFIGAKEIKLPFSMTLDRFKMDLVPGTTDKPASYESFVALKGHPENLTQAHVYMNNPLKTLGYTLYQASYLQDDNGAYHSILSVNKDPGRPVKYAGCLLLVASLILHFLILHGHIKFKE